MILAAGHFGNLFDHVLDHTWPGWSVDMGPLHVTLMSSGIPVTATSTPVRSRVYLRRKKLCAPA